MTSEMTTYQEPDPELQHRRIPAGEARVAVFTRTYGTTIEDLWDACTNPERLRRWYVPVTGDLRVGGDFQQVNMGTGTILECDPPRLLKLSLGGGADEIELRLSSGPEAGTTTLELPTRHDARLTRHRRPELRRDLLHGWRLLPSPASARPAPPRHPPRELRQHRLPPQPRHAPHDRARQRRDGRPAGRWGAPQLSG